MIDEPTNEVQIWNYLLLYCLAAALCSAWLLLYLLFGCLAGALSAAGSNFGCLAVCDMDYIDFSCEI